MPDDYYGVRLNWEQNFGTLQLVKVVTGSSQPVTRYDTVLAWGGTPQSQLRLRVFGDIPKVLSWSWPWLGWWWGWWWKWWWWKSPGKWKKFWRKWLKALQSGQIPWSYGTTKGYRDVVRINVFGMVVKGGIISGFLAYLSDIRLKEAIKPLSGALDKVKALRGVSFAWKMPRSAKKEMPPEMLAELREQRHIGFIAQEVEKICPDLISIDDQGYKSVDYARLTPILLEALKEQQAVIEAHQARLDQLEQIVRRLAAPPE
jgi:hypothetical protein